MRNSILALGTAAFASLCCTGPILLASLGATTLTTFSWLEPLRPYFSIGALGLVGFAFWRSYRPAAGAECCDVDKQAKLIRQRRTLWLATPLIALFISFPYLQASYMAGDASVTTTTKSEATKSTWAIANMTCFGCAAGLEATLAHEQGMLYCKVHFEEGLMDCQVDAKYLRESTIPVLVDQLGFRARLAETDGDGPA